MKIISEITEYGRMYGNEDVAMEMRSALETPEGWRVVLSWLDDVYTGESCDREDGFVGWKRMLFFFPHSASDALLEFAFAKLPAEEAETLRKVCKTNYAKRLDILNLAMKTAF